MAIIGYHLKMVKISWVLYVYMVIPDDGPCSRNVLCINNTKLQTDGYALTSLIMCVYKVSL